MLVSTVQGESLLLSKFRQFYTEVILLKRFVTSETWVLPTASSADDPNTLQKSVGEVGKRLLFLLEQQSLEMQQRGAEYAAIFREAQYVMVALADEVFLHLNWEGKAAWQANLLESRLFNSHGAGELFFQRMEGVLKQRDPAQVELAKLYLMTLALGFEGKFRGNDSRSQLDAYRRQLFSFIFQRNPDALHEYLYQNEAKRLFPEAYEHTLDQGIPKKIPDLRQWLIVLVLILLVFFAISHGLWLNLIEELEQVIQTIFSLK